MNNKHRVRGAGATGWPGIWLAVLLALGWWPVTVSAEAVCARVKIEIQQELTFERQGFDAVMRINNNLDTVSIDNVRVDVHFADSNGQGVTQTSNTNDPDAAFFIRVDRMDGISDVTGSGRVLPGTTGEIHWLIIPTVHAAQSPTGTLYFVGATLTYTIGGQQETVEVTPDFITVKPLPQLMLDYFLSRDVFGDEPMTTTVVEAPEPFTLGVRVRNNGQAPANNVRIDSAQPVIRENPQGLLIDFAITGSSVDEAPTAPSLLIDFGNVAPNSARMGRWDMVSTLAGEFISFTASMSHAEELGGATTSILSPPSEHFLVRNILVDEPGRDLVRDFLAVNDGSTTLMVYESDDTLDTPVTDLSTQANLALDSQSGAVSSYALTMSASSAGFMYVKLPDPNGGTKVVTEVIRSDGKRLPLHNAWASKERHRSETDVTYDYFVNLFDSNSTGRYTVVMAPAGGGPLPPVIQGVTDKVTSEGVQVGFLITASDPNGDAIAFSVSPRPVGAILTDNHDGTAYFNWTPEAGQAGRYTLTVAATDGSLASTESVTITVNPAGDTDGDGMDDAWELTHFGNLDRDGTGDFDGDGISDLDEFLNGTDPTQVETAATPVINPPGGSFTDYVEVTLTSETPNATIYFTMDGSVPGATSHRYTGPITVAHDTTLRAVAGGTGFADSEVAEAAYVITSGGPFQQSGFVQRLLVVEAENHATMTPRGDHNWVPDYTLDHTGDSAMRAQPDTGGAVALADSPSLDFRVNFLTTGTHYIWVRGRAPDGDGDLIHVGLDGNVPASSDALVMPTGAWGWRRMTADGPVASLNAPSTGEHTLQIWMGEDGVIVDKILLTTDPNYIPSGAGPAESLTNSTNAVPVLQAIANRTGVRGASVNFTIPAADPDNDVLAFSATGLPAGLTLDAAGGTITGVIDAAAASANAVAVTVGDGRDTVTTAFVWNVLAQDNTVPAVTAPADVTVEATAVMTPVSLGAASAVDDVDGVLAVVDDAPAAFPLGETLVTYTAFDSTGNEGSATTRVTVVDTTAPQLSAPPDRTVISTAPTAVDIGTASASDIFEPVTITNDAPAVFPVGTTTVTWTAADANANTASAQQRITVAAADVAAPVVTAPADVTVEATAVTTPVALGEATAHDDLDGAVAVTHDAPAAFALGATVVTYSAIDAAGNTGTAVQTVTVVDTTAPVLTVPADVSVETNIAAAIAVDIGTATATDIFGPVTIGNDAPSAFPPGVTLVTWTAADANGNSASGQQTVTVSYTSSIVPDGDVNGDGLLNLADLLLAQRHVLGIVTLDADQIARGDLFPVGSPDGLLTASDLLLIQRAVLGASVNWVDTDGDLLPDDWETANGLDPSDPADAAFDADSDGLSNAQERAYGTNPHAADTDGDGVSDGSEVSSGTDPSEPGSVPVYITSQPAGEGAVGSLYSYALTANHAGATFELVQGPESAQLVIDGSGTRLEWTPAWQDIGAQSITLRAVVSGAPSIAQAFTVDIPPNGDMSGDNLLNVADTLLMERAILGLATVTAEQLLRADIYPQSSPDGQIDLSDLMVLKTRVLGGQ